MVFIQGNYIGDAVLRKLAQPLDQYFAQNHVSDGYFLPGMARWAHFGGHWWAIPAVSGPLGGQYIYLPQYTTPLGYNNANLVTFDDYYQMSRKAVRFDAAGKLLRIGYWPGTDSWETIATLMCSPGHGLYDAHDQPTATDPCNLAYLQYLKKLVDLYGGYDKLRTFLSGDPDYLEGNRGSYFVQGKEILPSTGYAYWNIPPLDTFGYGVQGGVRYQLTTMPVTAHGSLTEAANYPSTQQEIIIPRGAAHPDAAFAASKMICWDYNYLLGRAVGGSAVVKSQNTWLKEVIAVEAATRQQAHLPGNPIAGLRGVQMQPMLGLLSKAANPINPVDLAYQADLARATDRVLSGQLAPEAALLGVQKQVLADQQKLRSQYGTWNW
jgi:ABC-type glycerol-3-phosphate transport system substrate-binding protein